MSRPLVSGAALLMAAVLTISGCSNSQGEAVPSPQDRPSLEAVAAQLAEAEERIQAAVSEILPDGTWTRSMASRTSPCAENGETVEGGKRLFQGNWGFDAIPTETQWSQIRETLRPILAEYGYTRVTMDAPVADGATYSVAGLYEGASFSIQYNKATAMILRSGCHLPEDVER